MPQLLDAVQTAAPHDWRRARRIVVLLVNRLDRLEASADSEHEAKRARFVRIIALYVGLLFPVLLSVVRKPDWRATLLRDVFAIAQQLKRWPVAATEVLGKAADPPQTA